MAVVEITKENAEAEVKGSEILAVLDFWGPKCVPCMALYPKYHELAENPKYEGKVKFCFKVMQQPTFLYYKNGEEVGRIGGDDTTIEAITAKVEELM